MASEAQALHGEISFNNLQARPDFQRLPRLQQQAAADQFFIEKIAPRLSPEQIPAAREQFQGDFFGNVPDYAANPDAVYGAPPPVALPEEAQKPGFFETVGNKFTEQATAGLVDRPESADFLPNLLGAAGGGLANYGLGAGIGALAGLPFGPLGVAAGARFGGAAGSGLGAFGQDVREQLNEGKNWQDINYLRSGTQGLGAFALDAFMPGGGVVKNVAYDTLGSAGLDAATQLADRGYIDPRQTLIAAGAGGGFGLGAAAAGRAFGRAGDGAASIAQQLRDARLARQRQPMPLGMGGLSRLQAEPPPAVPPSATPTKGELSPGVPEKAAVPAITKEQEVLLNAAVQKVSNALDLEAPDLILPELSKIKQSLARRIKKGAIPKEFGLELNDSITQMQQAVQDARKRGVSRFKWMPETQVKAEIITDPARMLPSPERTAQQRRIDAKAAFIEEAQRKINEAPKQPGKRELAKQKLGKTLESSGEVIEAGTQKTEAPAPAIDPVQQFEANILNRRKKALETGNQKLIDKEYRKLETDLGKVALATEGPKQAKALELLGQIQREQAEIKTMAKARKGKPFESEKLIAELEKTPKQKRQDLKSLITEVQDTFEYASQGGEVAAYEVLQDFGYKVKKKSGKKGIEYEVTFAGKQQRIPEWKTMGALMRELKNEGLSPSTSLAKQLKSQGDEGRLREYQKGADQTISADAKQLELDAELTKREAGMQDYARSTVQKARGLLDELDKVTTEKELDAIQAKAENLDASALPEAFWHEYAGKVAEAADAIVKPPAKTNKSADAKDAKPTKAEPVTLTDKPAKLPEPKPVSEKPFVVDTYRGKARVRQEQPDGKVKSLLTGTDDKTAKAYAAKATDLIAAAKVREQIKGMLPADKAAVLEPFIPAGAKKHFKAFTDAVKKNEMVDEDYIAEKVGFTGDKLIEKGLTSPIDFDINAKTGDVRGIVIDENGQFKSRLFKEGRLGFVERDKRLIKPDKTTVISEYTELRPTRTKSPYRVKYDETGRPVVVDSDGNVVENLKESTTRFSDGLQAVVPSVELGKLERKTKAALAKAVRQIDHKDRKQELGRAWGAEPSTLKDGC